MEFGCSSFTWETADGLHFLGRTYDQRGGLANNRVLFWPRGTALPLMPGGPGSPGRYAFTGMAAMDFGEPVVTDGVNEQGLAIALLNFPGYAVYPHLPERRPVYPGFLPGYLLSRCGTLAEALDALSEVCLTDPRLQGSPLQAHYILTDPGGEAVIVEPTETGLAIHRNTIGVLTNSPDYLWQRTNLRNYAGITAHPVTQQTLVNCELTPFGSHTGVGTFLPGGYSSPDRFVRLAFMKNCAPRAMGEADGVTAMFRCFAVVDTPPGLMDPPEDPFQTLCISVMCLESRTYYFSTAASRRISAIRLDRLKAQTAPCFFPLPERQDFLWADEAPEPLR